MLISCPKCRSVYDISTKRIPEKGKKFKCAECGEIWTVYPDSNTSQQSGSVLASEDININQNKQQKENHSGVILNIKPDVSDDIDVMFNRLSQNTQNLFANTKSKDSLNWWQRLKYRITETLTPYSIIAFLLPICIIFGGALLYCYRYDIAAKIPGMDNVYAQMNYDSLYKGKDLVFKDVNIRNIHENGRLMLEISGRLQNSGQDIVTLLPVQALILNQNDEVLDKKIHVLQERQLEPDFSALFRIVMPYPSELDSKVRLTLTQDTDNN